MRSPRGVTLASVQLSSLPDASSPAPLPEQSERGNRRTRVLPLQSHSMTLRGLSRQSILSHAPIKTSPTGLVFPSEVNVVAAVFFLASEGKTKLLPSLSQSFQTPSTSLLASGYFHHQVLTTIFSFPNFLSKSIISLESSTSLSFSIIQSFQLFQGRWTVSFAVLFLLDSSNSSSILSSP